MELIVNNLDSLHFVSNKVQMWDNWFFIIEIGVTRLIAVLHTKISVLVFRGQQARFSECVSSPAYIRSSCFSDWTPKTRCGWELRGTETSGAWSYWSILQSIAEVFSKIKYKMRRNLNCKKVTKVGYSFLTLPSENINCGLYITGGAIGFF